MAVDAWGSLDFDKQRFPDKRHGGFGHALNAKIYDFGLAQILYYTEQQTVRENGGVSASR
jgi:hypothetical protein